MRTHLPVLFLLAVWSLWFLTGPALVQTVPERTPGFVDASRAAGDWAAAALVGDRTARSRAGVEKAWSLERDQAPLPKLLMGLSARWLTRWLGPWGALCAPLFLLGLASAWMAWRLAERAAGRSAGFAAVALLLFAPGYLHVLHTPTPEAVIGFSWIFLAYAVLRGFESARWRAVSLLAAGLAAASHAQGVALGLGLWLATWWVLRDRDGEAPGERGFVRGPRLPWNVALLPVAGVLLLLALWPLAQVSGKKALEALWLAPLRAVHPPFAFGGRLLDGRAGEGPAAWMGLLDVAWRLAPALLMGLVVGAWRGFRHRTEALVLPGSLLALSLLVCCLNGSASYDGLRLDLAMLPLVASLAGPGLIELGRALGPQPGTRYGWSRRVLAWLPVAAVVSVAAEAVVVLPYDRFYRSPLAPAVWSGGSEGSTLDVQGALLEPWLADLADTHPGGASLAVLPREAAFARTLDLLKRLKRLPKGLATAPAAEARCLGLAHLPETAPAGELDRAVGERREVIRYMLHGVPLFRVVCGDPPPKPRPKPKPKPKPSPTASAVIEEGS